MQYDLYSDTKNTRCRVGHLVIWFGILYFLVFCAKVWRRDSTCWTTDLESIVATYFPTEGAELSKKSTARDVTSLNVEDLSFLFLS